MDPPPQGQFYLIDGLDIVANGITELVQDPAIFGANLNPDPAKTLISIDLDGSVGTFVFLGATGW